MFVRLDPIVLLEGQRCDFIVLFISEREHMPDYIRVVARSTNSQVVKYDHPLPWRLHRDALRKCESASDRTNSAQRLMRLRLCIFEREGDKAANILSALYNDIKTRGDCALDEYSRRYGLNN